MDSTEHAPESAQVYDNAMSTQGNCEEMQGNGLTEPLIETGTVNHRLQNLSRSKVDYLPTTPKLNASSVR
jgi:hypothetical protein